MFDIRVLRNLQIFDRVTIIGCDKYLVFRDYLFGIGAKGF
jgi:hypothetical protein